MKSTLYKLIIIWGIFVARILYHSHIDEPSRTAHSSSVGMRRTYNDEENQRLNEKNRRFQEHQTVRTSVFVMRADHLK